MLDAGGGGIGGFALGPDPGLGLTYSERVIHFMGTKAPPLDILRQNLIADAAEMQRRRLVTLSGLRRQSTINRRLLRCGLDVDSTGHKFRCNRPFCASCGARRRNHKTKNLLLPLCEAAVAGGYIVAHLTIVLAPTASIDDVTPLLLSAKRKISGCRTRLGRRHPLGLQIAADGMLELSLVPDNELPHVSEGRRRTLTELGFPSAEFGGPVWCPHLHFLLFVPPDQQMEDVGAELRRVFPAWRQVHVDPLGSGKGLRNDVYRVARYGAKFAMKTEVSKSNRRNWSTEEVSLALDWTEKHSAQGMRGLNVQFGMRSTAMTGLKGNRVGCEDSPSNLQNG